MANNGITKYAEKYLDTKFAHLHEEIKGVKKEVKGIRVELKKNGKCLNKIDKTMAVYKIRVRYLSILVAVIIIVLLLGVANGIELVTKGVLSFL